MEISVQEFKNWVASKDPNETYFYIQPKDCALGQFLKSKNIDFRWVHGTHVEMNDPPGFEIEIPENLQSILHLGDAEGFVHSFGDLSKALEEVN